MQDHQTRLRNFDWHESFSLLGVGLLWSSIESAIVIAMEIQCTMSLVLLPGSRQYVINNAA